MSKFKNDLLRQLGSELRIGQDETIQDFLDYLRDQLAEVEDCWIPEQFRAMSQMEDRIAYRQARTDTLTELLEWWQDK